MRKLSKITKLSLAGIISALLVSTVHAGTFNISATKHKKDKTSQTGTFRPNLEHTTDSYFYKISVRSNSPTNEQELNLQYLIYVQNPDGKIVVAAKDSLPIGVTLNAPMTLETKTFELNSLELDRAHRRDRKIESELYGYAIRLVDSEGEVAAEKLSSSKLKSLVDWGTLDARTKPVKDLKPGPGKRPRKMQKAFQ